jgi:RimJ/RimL family protein N-acetyltransferase
MSHGVRVYDDPKSFSAVAQDFLLSRPTLHNVILTRLADRFRRDEPGRYWVATQDGQVKGVVFHSPLTEAALLVPMKLSVVAALVDAMADAGAVLPGVQGGSATAARFAGRWTERQRVAAFPTRGLRLYELAQLNEIEPVEGQLREFEALDRPRVIPWIAQFQAEVHEAPMDPERQLDDLLTAGRIWLWEDEGISCMAISRQPIQGVVRLSGVYTPPHKRRRGYAAACVYGVSKYFTETSHRCILYTDLGNPTSNSIYRQLGYQAVAEVTHYRFDPC